ncbi:hypothetical protein ACLOJK_011410 [Asimina triloba]
MDVAIPIVPTIRVLVTFTKFEELQPAEEFSTPLSSPAHFQDSKAKEAESSSASWISWMKGNRGQSSDGESRSWKDETDPFHVPTDYMWVDANEKKRRMKAKKAKSRKGKKQVTRSTEVEFGLLAQLTEINDAGAFVGGADIGRVGLFKAHVLEHLILVSRALTAACRLMKL